MSKGFVFGFVTGLTLLVIGGVSASHLQRQEAGRAKEQAEIAEYRAELMDATPVQVGILTANERIHSKLYKRYLQLRNNRTISGLIAEARGKHRIVETGVFVGLGPVLTEPETPESYFGKLSHASDAVILGKVTSKASQITEDDGFIFTDYQVLVSEVFKNNVSAPVDVAATIIVTRSGGKVVLDDVVVRARDDAAAPLPQNNHDIVLFLKFIPESGAYEAQDTGAFEVDGPLLKPLTGCAFPPGVLCDGNSFVQTARTVANR